ncbi:RNA-binding domain-containing protein [Coprinopsis marcescibilis]|uniref:RNA-binding domain-containing protein n=1 Tax=Coprinopsis marcescibilis TaxID=230819 RepID=A0A5C3KZJ1_COPMA|nr:RNA-binding domain-containing protein [Coprinopsis marcescibilis]
MNVVREINAINEKELELGLTASWHDEYKDSARIFAGGLHSDLTEGDVITIFSQYGEILDINMPRDKETGKPKGFAFLMYEDQRSTVLAVDNLNGAKVLERTLRVDHVKHYRQPKNKNDEGEMVEQDEEVFNAKPEMIVDGPGAVSDSSESSGPEIDPEDPMRDYLLAQRREAKAKRKEKKKSKGKHKDETPEERAARKARKKEKKARKGKSDNVKAVESLLSSLGVDRRELPKSSRSKSPSERRRHSRSRSPDTRHRRHRSRSPDYDPQRRSRYPHEDDGRAPGSSRR